VSVPSALSASSARLINEIRIRLQMSPLEAAVVEDITDGADGLAVWISGRRTDPNDPRGASPEGVLTIRIYRRSGFTRVQPLHLSMPHLQIKSYSMQVSDTNHRKGGRH
jgi:hypothetical protein